MHKMHKSIIVISLLCSVTGMTVISYAEELDDLRNKREEIEVQIDESNTELGIIDEQLTENLQQIQKLDENISSSEKNLEDLNSGIIKKEEEISKVEEELRKITEKYDIQKDILDKRLVTMYENGRTNYLDVLLGSESIMEFISSYFLISEITDYDMDLLDLVNQEKEQIEKKNTELNKQKEKLETEKRTMQKTQIALSNTKLLRQNYMSKLTVEEQALQAKIDEYNRQIQEIENEIKNLVVTASLGEDYQGGRMYWPVYDHFKITSPYGMRTHPITGVYKLHSGVDVSASTGTDFRAIANGIVVKAGYNTAYGNMVILDHGGGVQTLYAHGSSIEVKLGDKVNAGDVVLKVGSTGYATGPHAHFEVRINGETVNPLDYVPMTNEIPEKDITNIDNLMQNNETNMVENSITN